MRQMYKLSRVLAPLYKDVQNSLYRPSVPHSLIMYV